MQDGSLISLETSSDLSPRGSTHPALVVICAVVGGTIASGVGFYLWLDRSISKSIRKWRFT